MKEFYNEFLNAKSEFVQYFGHELTFEGINYNCIATELTDSNELKIGGLIQGLEIAFTLWEDDFVSLPQPINGKIVIFKGKKYRVEKVESSVHHPMFQIYCSSIHK